MDLSWNCVPQCGPADLHSTISLQFPRRPSYWSVLGWAWAHDLVIPRPMLERPTCCLRLVESHLKTPALLMTPSKSFSPTPLPTPLPPLASKSISFIVCSPTSSFNSRATLLKQAIVILPSSPPILVNNLNASSTSRCWLSSLLLLNLSAATATKCA